MRIRLRAALGVLPALVMAGLARGEPAPAPFPRPFHVIAHRGASGYAPENTLAALRVARELGAFEVEIDTQLSRDGVVVVFHDKRLEQKTPLHGVVADYDAARLTRVDMGAWFDRTHPEAPRRYAGERLVSLEEILEAFGPSLHYHVELKSPDADLAAAVVAAVRRHGLESRVTLSSSHFVALEHVRALAPELDTCLLIGDREELAQEAARRARRRPSCRPGSAGRSSAPTPPVSARWACRRRTSPPGSSPTPGASASRSRPTGSGTTR